MSITFRTSQVGSVKKTARFDEDNIRRTYHPGDKDYGHNVILEPKTPFERNEDAIDPELLHEKILAYKSSMGSSLSSTSSMSASGGSGQEGESFQEKRRKFYASEFLIAKQMAAKRNLRESRESERNGAVCMRDVEGDIELDTSLADHINK